MDSMDLERERGITIMAKNTAVRYLDTIINICDTPGHADFGGEVERTLSMVDGVVLLVDASEGPAAPDAVRAAQGARAPARADRRHQQGGPRRTRACRRCSTRSTTCSSTSTPTRISSNFPVIYAVARDGKASLDPNVRGEDLRPLFDAIIEHTPPPQGRSGRRAADPHRQPRCQRVPRTHRHRPHLQRPRHDRRLRRRLQAGWLGAADAGDQAVRLRRPEARRRAGSGRRRHRLPRRHGGHHHRRDGDQRRDAQGDPADRGGRADGVDDLRRQHVADGRPGRPVRHLAPDQGAPREGTPRQRLAARRAHRHARADARHRPWRAAAVDPDRDDAARGLRAAGVAAGDRHRATATRAASNRSRTWSSTCPRTSRAW